MTHTSRLTRCIRIFCGVFVSRYAIDQVAVAFALTIPHWLQVSLALALGITLAHVVTWWHGEVK